MKKNWLLMVGVASVLAIVGLAGCSPGNTVLEGVAGINITSQATGIWVSGQGKVTAVPDIATLRLGIEAEAASVAEAQGRAAEAMDRVMTALTGNGVVKKDIQTQYFNITKVTRWDDKNQRELIIGYRVTNIVTAKIRDIDKAGTIIDAVAEAGGDLTRIDNIAFSVDDPSAYYEAARQEAMAEAKAKAKQLAELSGVSLGKPTYISENIQLPSPIYQTGAVFAAEKAAAVETPISPGEMEVSLSLQVVYAIQK
ncbi:MAG: SIMPL domain-containing protein [Chloroflexi bacterium]|nr:SIMPL domain-containing protein [Chloroflexota bacterium]